MEKELFIDVLKHYYKSSENEALNIVGLKENFPYSQVLQVLSARVVKDHGLGDSQNSLQMAAVYAADRAVLKDVMTRDNLQAGPIRDHHFSHLAIPVPERVFERSEYVEEKIEESAPINIENQSVDNFEEALKSSGSALIDEPADRDSSEAHQPPGTGELRGNNGEDNMKPVDPLLPGVPRSMADQVMGDLETLNRSKHNFEEMFRDFEKTFASIENSESTLKNTPIAPQITTQEDLPTDQGVVSSNENSYPVTQSDESKAPLPEPDEFRTRPLPRRKLQPPTIIDEIEHSKEELEPENPKQKEQLEMIDQFIRTQPSLTASRDKQFDADGDLTTIRTGEFSDNIVSETLVEILLKQGKKDKAIEVLKKLIWKFPQKKAYFAAQIEELKK